MNFCREYYFTLNPDVYIDKMETLPSHSSYRLWKLTLIYRFYITYSNFEIDRILSFKLFHPGEDPAMNQFSYLGVFNPFHPDHFFRHFL